MIAMPGTGTACNKSSSSNIDQTAMYFLKVLKAFLSTSLAVFLLCAGKSAEEWKSRVIYHILTDRFAPSGELPSAKCTDMRGWCGGTFKGRYVLYTNVHAEREFASEFY